MGQRPYHCDILCGFGSESLVINFATTLNQIQSVLGLIGFTTTSDTPSTVTREISVQLTDLDGNNSELKARKVAVKQVNDAQL